MPEHISPTEMNTYSLAFDHGEIRFDVGGVTLVEGLESVAPDGRLRARELRINANSHACADRIFLDDIVLSSNNTE